jgi:hypothetical protein
MVTAMADGVDTDGGVKISEMFFPSPSVEWTGGFCCLYLESLYEGFSCRLGRPTSKAVD